jgi:hypothetical protein
LTHQILSEHKTPYKVYGNTRVGIPFSTPKSNTDNNYINMNMISHATKEERRIIRRQRHITSFVGAHYREKVQDGAEHKLLFNKKHQTKYNAKINNQSQVYTSPKGTHQILSAREIPYRGYDHTQKWIPLSTPKNNNNADVNIICKLTPPPSPSRGSSLQADHHPKTMPDPMSDISSATVVSALEDAIHFFTHFILDTSLNLAEELAPLPITPNNTILSESPFCPATCKNEYHASSACLLRTVTHLPNTTATPLPNTTMVVVEISSSTPDS